MVHEFKWKFCVPFFQGSVILVLIQHFHLIQNRGNRFSLEIQQCLCQSNHIIFLMTNDLRLKAGHAVVDSSHLVRAVWVHGGLELSLDQAWNNNNDKVSDFLFSPGDIPHTRMLPPRSLSSCLQPSRRPVTANLEAA